MRYSASLNGFFPNDIQYAELPDDLVEVELEHHAFLLMQQSLGKIISADKDGSPIVVTPPELSSDEKRNALSVPKLQFCLNLDKYRFLDDIFTYIDTLPRSNIFRLTWECNGAISYSDPNVQEFLHTVLNLDTVMSDDMFL
jgi:hypothetical protein